jgi:hypothetical protein
LPSDSSAQVARVWFEAALVTPDFTQCCEDAHDARKVKSKARMLSLIR